MSDKTINGMGLAPRQPATDEPSECAPTMAPTMAPSAALCDTMAPTVSDFIPRVKPASAPLADTMAPTVSDFIPRVKADGEAFVGNDMCGYVIKRKLAEGGMGVVLEGVHAKIGRRG